MRDLLQRLALLSLAGLGACATIPPGPSMLVLPGTGKSFDQFRVDDGYCKQYATEQVGGVTAQNAQATSGVTSALVGSAVGAAAGAAFGGGQGAAIGAGAGLLLGSAAGLSASSYSAYNVQARYDFAYQQCMYAMGNRVPVSGRVAYTHPRVTYSYVPPPPPPNYPPPPPPH